MQTRKRRMAEKAATGEIEDQEVKFIIILAKKCLKFYLNLSAF